MSKKDRSHEATCSGCGIGIITKGFKPIQLCKKCKYIRQRESQLKTPCYTEKGRRKAYSAAWYKAKIGDLTLLNAYGIKYGMSIEVPIPWTDEELAYRKATAIKHRKLDVEEISLHYLTKCKYLPKEVFLEDPEFADLCRQSIKLKRSMKNEKI